MSTIDKYVTPTLNRVNYDVSVSSSELMYPPTVRAQPATGHAARPAAVPVTMETAETTAADR